MASRNERRRRAKSRELALKQAVYEAFKAEASKPEPVQDFSRPWCTAGLQHVAEREGKSVNRSGKIKFISREIPYHEPPKVDGLDGRGQRCKSWLTGQPKR